MRSVAAILGVNDVQRTTDWFAEKLGFSLVGIFGMPADEGPVYSIVQRGEVEFHIQIRRREVWTGPREEIETDAYVRVSDADALHVEYRNAGVSIFRELDDADYGMRDFAIETPDGHRIAFGSPGVDG